MNINGFSRQELLELAWEKPIMAQVEVTRNCNQKCVFCFRGCGPTKIYRDLLIENWLLILQKCKNLGIRKLNFSGGESFLHRDFVSLVRRAKECGFTIVINTNGRFNIQPLIEWVDEFIFSVHGLSPTHNYLVGTENEDAFAITESNINLAASGSAKISINMVLVKSSYDQIEKVFGYFNSRYHIFKFSPTIAVQSLFGRRYSKEMLQVTPQLLRDYSARLNEIPPNQLELKHGFQSMFYGDISIYTSAVIPLPNCAAGKYKIVVDYNGRVYPCNFFKSAEFYCGNLLIDDEHKVWNSGKGFLRFRNLVLREKIPSVCVRCVKKYKCFSGCRAWSKDYQKGGFENVADLRCELVSAFIGS